MNPEGSETQPFIAKKSEAFESSVNPEGSETAAAFNRSNLRFESSVNPEGSETAPAERTAWRSLRAV